MLARNKLNCIESKKSEALINNEINHEDFTTIINEQKIIENKKKVLEKWSQRSDTQKSNLIKEGKRKGIDKIIRQNA